MSIIIEQEQSPTSPVHKHLIRHYRAAHALHYGYRLTLTDDEAPTELKCEYSITYIGTNTETAALYRVERSPVYINSQAPDTLAEELAAKVGTVLYPLELEVDAQGMPINIHNHAQILQRWQILKEELLDYYIGEVFYKYIVLSEQALLSAEILQEKLAQDWFISTYFAPYRGAYTQAIQTRYQQLPMPQGPALRHACTQTLNPGVDEHGEIEISVKGALDPEEQGSTEAVEETESSYQASYKLHAQRHTLESAHSRCGQRMGEHSLTAEVELFYIGEELPAEAPQGAFVVVDQWKKEGFWNRLFKK